MSIISLQESYLEEKEVEKFTRTLGKIWKFMIASAKKVYGGIYVGWNAGKTNMEVIASIDHFLTVVIDPKRYDSDRLLTIFYASHTTNVRNKM